MQIIYLYIASKMLTWIKAIPNIDLYTDKDLVINKIKNSTENVDIVILMSNGDNTYIINKLK